MGICLGMQLLFEIIYKYQNLNILSILNGSTKKLNKLVDQNNLKSPHVK